MFQIQKHQIVSLILIFLISILGEVCSFNQNENQANGLVVVNSPSTGIIKRLLISEQANIQANSALFEITIISNNNDKPENNNGTPPALINPVLLQKSQNNSQSSENSENTITVHTPVAGNIRFINVRVGQFIKAGQPIVTISTRNQ